jgi:CheY-like chemotaxis protein
MAGLRVLVVDDHLDTLNLYSTFLSLEGFSVTAASNGPDALRLSAKGFDAIATDLAMPGMDGAEFIRQLRAARPKADTPIVVVTGQADAKTEAVLSAIGSCRLLRKPCDLPALADLLRSLSGSCVHDCESCSDRAARDDVRGLRL